MAQKSKKTGHPYECPAWLEDSLLAMFIYGVINAKALINPLEDP